VKHTAAPARRIPVLSTASDVAALIAYAVWELLDDLADWLSRSRAAHTAAKVTVLVAVVVVLALLSGCSPIEPAGVEARS
jgi:predicted PurR-regulated permease PerM